MLVIPIRRTAILGKILKRPGSGSVAPDPAGGSPHWASPSQCCSPSSTRFRLLPLPCRHHSPNIGVSARTLEGPPQCADCPHPQWAIPLDPKSRREGHLSRSDPGTPTPGEMPLATAWPRPSGDPAQGVAPQLPRLRRHGHSGPTPQRPCRAPGRHQGWSDLYRLPPARRCPHHARTPGGLAAASATGWPPPLNPTTVTTRYAIAATPLYPRLPATTDRGTLMPSTRVEVLANDNEAGIAASGGWQDRVNRVFCRPPARGS